MDLTIRADSSEIRRATDWLSEAGAAQGVPENSLWRLDLCVTEALANVIAHGGAGVGANPLCLRLDVRRDPCGGEVAVTVSDGGTVFDPLTAPPKVQPHTLEDAEPGGQGLVLLRHFADALDYCHSEGRNHLTIHVRWDEARK